MRTTSEVKFDLAENIKRLRQERELTRIELADLMHLEGSTTIYNVEKCKANPSLETLVRIAKALRVDVHELLEKRSK